MVGALIYAVQYSFTGDQKTMFDFDKIILPVVVIAVLGLAMWETVIIVDFLLKDVKGIVKVDANRLTIKKGKIQEVLDGKDLIKIEFAEPRDGSRSLTANWTYAKLTFKNRVLFLTSLTMTNEEVRKEFGLSNLKSLSRQRRFFELIK
jgi:hypothetical protein